MPEQKGEESAGFERQETQHNEPAKIDPETPVDPGIPQIKISTDILDLELQGIETSLQMASLSTTAGAALAWLKDAASRIWKMTERYGVNEKLDIALDQFSVAARAVAGKVGARSYYIEIGFPSGITVGFNFDT